MTDNSIQTLEHNLCRDLETEGFDLQAGETWIYPTNYPVREYQFNITQKALLKNTLVSLPTGLGKTFIAAVVMFNFFRWYPLGKVIFMAPTRPLVKQQIDACYDIMAIPRDSTVEMTGAKLSNSREEIWNKKRVFFVTPQILQNDLDKFDSLAPKIKCLVFDEAHRAKGNHAYCEVIRKLSNSNKFFRVLALSATPGGSINDILEVVQNLLISHLEFRTEESLDVRPYVFQRNLTTVVVPLGDKLQEVKDAYMNVLEYYTRSLIKYKVIQGNCANLTKGKVFMLLKQYQTQNKGTSPNYGEIMKSLNICITLYHAAELLIRHGLRNFLNFFEDHIDKPLFRGNVEIREILNDVREYMGPLPEIQQLPDGEYPQMPEDLKFGHPKFYKLRDILVNHFKESGDSSRAIVFFEYRDSVKEACMLLIQSQPMLRPRIFVGQKQGVTQKSQINVVKAFREGRCNILLSTSIGEEGLDVGEVDLIVCFDISNKSPIRMVQRMGRTGRKKDGNVVVLVTEGKEQQTLKDCLIHKNNVAFHVLGSKELAKGLRTDCPRLVPEGLVPKCEKIFITVEKHDIKKGGNLKSMLRTLSSRSSEPTFSPDLKVIDVEEKIPTPELYSTKKNPFDDNLTLPNIFSKRIEKQRNFQETHKIQHSNSSEILVNLLQLAESRRFNIPMTQLKKSVSNKNLKQTDIRNMFFKSQSANDFMLPSTQSLPHPTQLTVVEDRNLGNLELFEELKYFLSIQIDEEKKCPLCPSEFNCENAQLTKRSSKPILTWIELDASVYLNITEQDLKDFKKEVNCQSFQFEDSMNFQFPNTPISKSPTQRENKILELEDLVDNSILSDIYNKTTNFQAPKSLTNLLNRYSTSLIDEEVVNTQQPLNLMLTEENIKKTLDFFKLESLDSLFDTITPGSQRTVVLSPDMFEDSLKVEEKVNDELEDSSSPILCSYVNKKRPQKDKNSKNEQNMESTSKMTPLELDDVFDFSFFQPPSIKKDQTVTAEKIISLTDSCVNNDFCKVFMSNSPPKSGSGYGENQKIDLDISNICDEELLKSPTISIGGRKRDFKSKKNLNESEYKNTNMYDNNKDTKDDGDEDHFAKYFDNCEIAKPKMPQKDETIEIPESLDFLDLIEQNSSKNIQEISVSRHVLKSTNRDESKQKSHLDSSVIKKSNKQIDDTVKKIDNPLKETSQPSITQKHSLANKPKQQNEATRKESNFTVPESKKCRLESNTVKKIDNPLQETSQLSITQILSLVNKPTQQNKATQKLGDFAITDTKKSGLESTTGKKIDNPVQETSSRLSITQIPSPVNNLTQQNKRSQKENLDKNICNFDDDFFNFSFNTKKPIISNRSSSSSEKSLKHTKYGHNSSVDTTLGSKSNNSSLNSVSKVNKNLNSSQSDDDFETKPKSPAWIRRKPLIKKVPREDSLDDFETEVKSPIFAKPKVGKKNKVRKNLYKEASSSRNKGKLVNQFIENEAELSICDEIIVSDDENELFSQDCYDESFVADNTIKDNTQMHGVYLESVKNVQFPNRFKIPMKFKNNMNVFSQPVEEEEDSYLDDSFVVHEISSETDGELSQLEILEKQLEMRKRRKKMLDDKKPTKRKRIIVDSDSD